MRRRLGEAVATAAFVAACWTICVLAGLALAGERYGVAYGVCMGLLWNVATVTATATSATD